MKKYLYIFIVCVIAFLIGLNYVQQKRIESYQRDVINLTTTVDAYSNENSFLKGRNREFALTIGQLNYLNDSLIVKMNEARKELKIKDKEIKRLGYISSTATRVDSVIFRDTIFTEKVKNIDTLIVDNNDWYRCDIGLSYPNQITVKPTFYSEKYIIVSSKKETIKPPKKCWLGRLFQKKHEVIIVDVVENNPYISSEKERFINIVK